MDFNFTGILDTDSSQEEVFQQVAVPVLQNCLDGYNGTIFAYGQTGSGKTYTINGSDSWAYRGIVPRVITYIFDQINERQDEYEYTVYVSYMEIYNEKAYDLLNEDHLVSPLEQWNKIEFKRDNQGNIHLNNITLHEISDAKPGIDLLMMGNYIRKQSATPMNQCSSRSHCIFTLTFEGNIKPSKIILKYIIKKIAKEVNTDNYFVSKLNLVDLAGSERVSKTNHDGVQLNEAKNINLSLSYLEQVIVALNEKKKTGQRQHIPYRHSILTTILKDSLGGNCMTVMITNISTELDNFEESISALRFSQRVGKLENEIHKNQKQDLNAVIDKLQKEKEHLKDELDKYKKIVGDLKDTDSTKSYGKISRSQSSQNSYKKQFGNNEEDDIFDPVESNQDLDQIVTKVQEYMQDNTDQLEVKNMIEANLFFKAMKEYHKSSIDDYLKELQQISKKLQQYDKILYQNQLQDSTPKTKDRDITQMILDQKSLNKQYSNSQNYYDENINPKRNLKFDQESNLENQQHVYQQNSQNIISSQSSEQHDQQTIQKLNIYQQKKQSSDQQQFQQQSKLNQQQKPKTSIDQEDFNLQKQQSSKINQQNKGEVLGRIINENGNIQMQKQSSQQRNEYESEKYNLQYPKNYRYQAKQQD